MPICYAKDGDKDVAVLQFIEGKAGPMAVVLYLGSKLIRVQHITALTFVRFVD